MGYQRVIIEGNLGKDPEMRFTANGHAVTSFSVAVGESRGSGDDRKEETEWFNCIAWNKTAEIIAQHFEKGKPILCEGKMRTRSWKDKDDVKQYRTELVLDRFTFIGGGKGEGGGGQRSSGGSAGGDYMPAGGGDFDPDDLPFE